MRQRHKETRLMDDLDRDPLTRGAVQRFVHSRERALAQLDGEIVRVEQRAFLNAGHEIAEDEAWCGVWR